MTRKRFLANIGDVGWLDHGGCFVYSDGSVAILEEPCDDEDEDGPLTLFWLDAPKCEVRLTDSETRVDGEHALIARIFDGGQDVTSRLRSAASACDQDVGDLVHDICSDDVVKRALAWKDVWAVDGFDRSYGVKLTRGEARRRFRHVDAAAKRDRAKVTT